MNPTKGRYVEKEINGKRVYNVQLLGNVPLKSKEFQRLYNRTINYLHQYPQVITDTIKMTNSVGLWNDINLLKTHSIVDKKTKSSFSDKRDEN